MNSFKRFFAFFLNKHIKHSRQLRLMIGIGLLLITAGIILFNRSGVSTYPVGWEKTFVVSPPKMNARNLDIAVRGNFIAVVFEGIEANVHRIYITLSFNGGKSFIEPFVMADVEPNIEHYPKVDISGNGHVAVVWQNIVAEDSKTHVFYSYSPDMGATWKEAVRLFLPSETELLPQVFYDDRNSLHMLYHGHRKNFFNLFHAVSYDEKTFEKPRSLANASALRGAFFPAVYSSGRAIYIVWQGKGERFGVLSDDLFFMKSGNYGRGWSSVKKITTSSANDASPSILLKNNTIYCIYQNNDARNWEIKLLRGYEGGKKWDAVPQTISKTNANAYSPVVLSPSKDELVFLWYDTRNIQPGITARKYSIIDRKFSNENFISRPKVTARNPVAVVIGNQIIAMWEENRRIVAKYSDVYAAPPGVYSRSHPYNTWSRNTEAYIQWRPPVDESGINGYAVNVNRDPDFVPTVQNVNSNVREYRIPGIGDGITYFHIRTIDGAGNYSRTLHYRLQVSRGPLPIPVVVSPTHAEAKPSPHRKSVFRWSISERDRLKGFIYGFAKDKIIRPETFTRNFETVFDKLEDGRYFFSIAAVDKTNVLGRVGTYEIIVNKADPITQSDYEKMAAIFQQGPRFQRPEKKKVIVPVAWVDFPFESSVPYDGNSFKALINVRNIKKSRITGYSVSVDTKRSLPVRQVNLRNNIITVTDLKDGRYFLGVSARYYKVINGKKEFFWTHPVVQKFAIQVVREPSEVLRYTESVMTRLEKKWMMISLSLISLALSIVTLGFGTKLSYFTRLFRFKLKNSLRLFF